MKKLSISLIALLLSSAAVLPASAASLINYGSTGVNVDAGATTNTSASTGGVNAAVNTDVNTNVDTNNTNTQGSANSAVTADTSVGATVVNVARGDINASVSTIGTVAPADVHTQDDLKSFAVNSMKSDANVQAVSFAADSVTVDYKDNGRFIGIIPVTVNAKTTVDTSGNVTVNYPWYDFLVMKHSDELQADLQTKVGDMIRTNQSGAWTAEEQAQVAARLSAALKDHFGADASATSSTSAAASY